MVYSNCRSPSCLVLLMYPKPSKLLDACLSLLLAPSILLQPFWMPVALRSCSRVLLPLASALRALSWLPVRSPLGACLPPGHA